MRMRSIVCVQLTHVVSTQSLTRSSACVFKSFLPSTSYCLIVMESQGEESSEQRIARIVAQAVAQGLSDLFFLA